MRARLKSHDRLPVIVDAGDFDRWLDPTTPTDKLQPLLDSRPVAGMEVVAVNPAVNNPGNQGPDCLAPISPSSLAPCERCDSGPV
jgi:putative SOS response-associated peptidase YedK